jgi:hypothetical protein
MKTNQAMKHDIEDILNSLDHIKKAEAPPYFYSQLLNRMEKEQPSVISRALQSFAAEYNLNTTSGYGN